MLKRDHADSSFIICIPRRVTAGVHPRMAFVRLVVLKVFEVNTSDQRDGKHLLTRLQEATQSHQLPRTALAPSAEPEPHSAPGIGTLKRTALRIGHNSCIN